MSDRKVARFELFVPDGGWKDRSDEPIWEPIRVKVLFEPRFGGIVLYPQETADLKDRIYRHLREIEELISETYKPDGHKDTETLSPIFGSKEVKR